MRRHVVAVRVKTLVQLRSLPQEVFELLRLLRADAVKFVPNSETLRRDVLHAHERRLFASKEGVLPFGPQSSFIETV